MTEKTAFMLMACAWLIPLALSIAGIVSSFFWRGRDTNDTGPK